MGCVVHVLQQKSDTGQPYDWFNLDDMGSLIHSEEFASTLKENINHYFEVGFEDQAVMDEDGILVAPADFLRALQHPRPYFRVYNLRQMPPELKEQTSERLGTIAQEAARMKQVLARAPLAPRVEAAAPLREAPGCGCLSLPREGLSAGFGAARAPTPEGSYCPEPVAAAPAPGPWAPSSQSFDQMQAQASPSCPKCGQPYVEEGLFCRSCGQLRAATPAELRTMPAAPVAGRLETSVADRVAGDLRTFPGLTSSSVSTAPPQVFGGGSAPQQDTWAMQVSVGVSGVGVGVGVGVGCVRVRGFFGLHVEWPLNHRSDSQSLGLVYALAAAIAFGIQYVPARRLELRAALVGLGVKKYEIFEGTAFQWFMGNGILMMGFLIAVSSGQLERGLSPLVMLGGVLWAMSNYLVLPLVKLLGIGLGFSLYHFVNLMVGYCIGRFGLFGVKKLSGELWICDIGCGLILLSFFAMVFVEAGHEPESDDSDASECESLHIDPADATAVECDVRFMAVGGFSVYGVPEGDQAAVKPAKANDLTTLHRVSSLDRFGRGAQRIIGVILAIFAGALCGVNGVPATIYEAAHPEVPAVATALPQCFGIWVCSSVILIIYSSLAVVRGVKLQKSVIGPAYVSGCIWGVGFACMMQGIKYLGYSVGYTLDAVGPILVSSLLSVFVFREITGKKSLLIYTGLAQLGVQLGVTVDVPSMPNPPKAEPTGHGPCQVHFEAERPHGLRAEKATCASCGAQNAAEDEYCCKCGASMAEPLRSLPQANGKAERFGAWDGQFEVSLVKEAKGPAPACTCGNVFMPDAEFCRKCGLKRDMASRPDRFGFANVPTEDGRSLQVTWVDPGGLLARWNTLHPDKSVQEGDLIVAVNNVGENVEAMRVQLQLSAIRITLQPARTRTASKVGSLQTLQPLQTLQTEPMLSAAPPMLSAAPPMLAAAPPPLGNSEGTRLVLPQEVSLPSCPGCGNMYMTDSVFCRRCGRPRGNAPLR
ncbi:unnamed protein product [Effrenium voratum]|uniref:Uncharacterized protein n=1 Tax=Effrenium voratum TaxID=2562239 RepID=A0AA36NFI9_9DINO|nr:unnamed protein product [Effrenium voratum]